LKAQQASRARQHLNIHQSFDDSCQRLLNAIGVSSYIRPHRHAIDPKVESLIAVKGLFALIIFSEDGEIAEIINFGSEKFDCRYAHGVGVELAPRVWHTVVALSDSAVLLEVKAGPFNPELAKELAPWAPEEGTDAGVIYLNSLKQAIQDQAAAIL
jgi:cupin fold WbuC family metalloprotein